MIYLKRNNQKTKWFKCNDHIFKPGHIYKLIKIISSGLPQAGITPTILLEATHPYTGTKMQLHGDLNCFDYVKPL